MTDMNLWVVTSTHQNPNDFYVKVDGSQYYTAYWVVRCTDERSIDALVLNVADELDLGNCAIKSRDFYPSGFHTDDPKIRHAVEENFSKLENGEDVQLGAWVSANGGLW